MLDPTTHNPMDSIARDNRQAPQPRFQMKRDPDARTAGSVPVWEYQRGQAGAAEDTSFKSALGYADDVGGPSETSEQAFGFGDLVDIVNPLHHIPLVSTLYENVTGDTIRPTGRIIGGALFGGFAGAAAGIANVIVEEETGKDMAGNVVALVTEGTLPSAKPDTMSPEDNLNYAARLAFNGVDAEPLPPLAFGINPMKSAATIEKPSSEYVYEASLEDDRMAGIKTVARKRIETFSPLPLAPLSDPASINLATISRENQQPITQLRMTPLK
jgi:hypothetical protein